MYQLTQDTERFVFLHHIKEESQLDLLTEEIG